MLVELHMDDFHGTGPVDSVTEAVEELRELFVDLKAREVINTGRYSHLKRDRLRQDGRTLIRPNVRHIDDLIELMGMEKAKASPTPSLTGNEPEESVALKAEGASVYRRGVGICLYIAADRGDTQRDVQLLARRLSSPTEWDYKRLVRMTRYLNLRCAPAAA